jgi:predicted extracellular nuclease
MRRDERLCSRRKSPREVRRRRHYRHLIDLMRSDEETRIAAMEKHNKELKAKLVEQDTAQMTKTKATSATSETKNNISKSNGKLPESTSHRCCRCECFEPNPTVEKREQLNYHDVGQIQQEVQVGQHPELKGIAGHSPI